MKALAAAMVLIGLVLTAGAAGAIEHDTLGIAAGIAVAAVGIALLILGGWIARRSR